MYNQQMSCPAPRRMSVEVPGGYFTKPWTEDAVRDYKNAGGWFLKGQHDFADRQAAILATGKDETEADRG